MTSSTVRGRYALPDTTRPSVPKIIQALETTEEAMRARDVAKLFGVTCQHVYKMASDGTIPSFHVGTAVRFGPVLVADWLRCKMPQIVTAPGPDRVAV